MLIKSQRHYIKKDFNFYFCMPNVHWGKTKSWHLLTTFWYLYTLKHPKDQNVWHGCRRFFIFRFIQCHFYDLRCSFWELYLYISLRHFFVYIVFPWSPNLLTSLRVRTFCIVMVLCWTLSPLTRVRTYPSMTIAS